MLTEFEGVAMTIRSFFEIFRDDSWALHSFPITKEANLDVYVVAPWIEILEDVLKDH